MNEAGVIVFNILGAILAIAILYWTIRLAVRAAIISAREHPAPGAEDAADASERPRHLDADGI